MAEYLRQPERRGFWRSLPKGSTSLAMCVLALLGMRGDMDFADTVQKVHSDAGVLEDYTVKIMTANVHGWRAPDGSGNMDDLLSAMREHDVDIACLQEVDVTEGQLDQLYDAGYNVVYAETERDGYGNAVISETKIDMQQNYNLPPSTDKIRQRGALLVQAATKTGEIELLATHITTRQRYQPLQFGTLGKVVHKQSADVVCGDLNGGISAIAHSTLGEYFSKPIASHIGAGNTFPARAPDREIDFVFSRCKQEAIPKSAGIMSDHLGVVYEFALPGCE